MLSKIGNGLFQATCLTYLLDGLKAGAQRIMSRHLGMMVDRPFDALPPETQRAFQQYRISPAGWEALRTVPDRVNVDGRVHLIPDAASRASSEAVGATTDTRTRHTSGGVLKFETIP